MALRRVLPRVALSLAAALGAGLWGAVVATTHLAGRETPLDRLEGLLVDLRVLISGPRPAPPDLVIVAIDDDTVRAAGAYPLPRRALAELVAATAQRRPRAIGLDILLIDPGPAEGDAALVNALRQTPTVIAAAALFRRDDGARGLAAAERIILPQEEFASVAGLGLVNIASDYGGTPRHVPLVVAVEGGAALPSFPLRLATLAAGADPVLDGGMVTLGTAATRTDLGLSLPLRFYGPRGTIRTVSAGDVLAGRLPADALADRIAIIGATAVGTGDTFATPFDPVLPGVEVLATAVGHLTTGDGLRRTLTERRIDAAAAVGLPLLAALLIALRRAAVGVAVLAGATAAWAAFAVLAFGRGTWLSLSVPLAAVVPPAVACGLLRLWLDQRVERRLRAAQRTLRRFQPAALAARLAAAPDFLSEPVPQDAGILFMDLSGFTGLAEELGPERTRTLLKELHGIIEDEVTREGGLVISFMGDGAMVVFGLPVPGAKDAGATLAAALALGRRLRGWLAGTAVPGGGRLGVRVGAHFGRVVASRLGADTHQHITATGDNVNVASRLLEVARQERALVVISSDLHRAAGAPAIPGLGPERTVSIRGRSRPLAVRVLPA